MKPKGIWLCNEPADSQDYACNQCGGDIRGLKCCSREHCTYYPLEQSEQKKEKI